MHSNLLMQFLSYILACSSKRVAMKNPKTGDNSTRKIVRLNYTHIIHCVIDHWAGDKPDAIPLYNSG